MAAITGKNLDSKLPPEPVHLMRYSLPDEIWCHIFSYLDDKSLRNVSVICKLWFGIIRGNEKFSWHIKMKFTNLEDMSTKITDSKWLRERWPSMRVLEVSLGSQCLIPHYEKLAPQMTKIVKLEPLHINEDEQRTGWMASGTTKV